MNVEFRDANGGCLADVGIPVLEAVTEGLDECSEDGGDLDVGHGADRESSYECVLVVRILDTPRQSVSARMA